MPVLQALQLYKAYGRIVAVDHIDFSLEAGHVLGIIGPNGAGKTTTLSMLAGVLQPDSGRVLVHGEVLDRSRLGPRFGLGWVPQDLAVYGELTVRENLAFFGGLFGIPPRRLRSRIDEFLEICSLTESADRLVETLSGGTKRRLNLASGLIHRPEILILDEPTLGLDMDSRDRILEHLATLAGAGVSMVYAGHDLNECQRICNRILLLDGGQVVAQDHVQGILHRLGGWLQLEVEGYSAEPELVRRLEEFSNVSCAAHAEVLRIEIEGASSGDWNGAGDTLAKVLLTLQDMGVSIRKMKAGEPTLEQALAALRSGKGGM